MFPETARDEVLIEALGDELVVYDLVRHRAHCLNKSAALVWRHCDGKTTIAELAKLLQKELGLPALDEDLVWLALGELQRAELLQEPMERPEGAKGISRREMTLELAKLCDRLPESIPARRIETKIMGESRLDCDVGPDTVSRNLVATSLDPVEAKIWICERRITGEPGPLEDIGFGLLSHAAQSAKLHVPRWATANNPKTGQRGEGLRAPRPWPEDAWLDLKGGFVGSDGAHQEKDQGSYRGKCTGEE